MTEKNNAVNIVEEWARKVYSHACHGINNNTLAYKQEDLLMIKGLTEGILLTLKSVDDNKG